MRRSPLFPRPVRAGSAIIVLLTACRAPEAVDPSPRAADPPTQSDDLPLSLEVSYVPNHLAALGTVRMADASGELALAYGPVGGELERRTPSVVVGPGQQVEVPVLGLSPGEWSVADGNNRPVSRPYSRLARFVFAPDRQTGWVDWAYGAPPPSDEYFLLETAGDIDGAGPDGVRFTHHHDDDGWVTQVGWEADVLWEWRLPGRGELYRTEAYTSVYGDALP